MADYELIVDADVCEANALCVGIAPDLFDLDDDEQLHVRLRRPRAEVLELAQDAVNACPKRALALKPLG